MKKIANIYNSLGTEKRAAIWSLFAGVVQKGIGVLVTPIFTRILTTEEYAQFTLYQSWHDIFIIFATLNVFFYCTYTALAKFEDDKDGFILSAQSFISTLCLLLAFIFFIGQTLVQKVTHYSFPIMLLMIVDILFWGSFNLWLNRERYEFRYKLLTILSVINGCLGPIISFILILIMNTNKGFGRIYGMAFSNICIGFCIYVLNIRKAGKFFSFKYWKYILTFCLPLIPHFLSTILLSRFDRIMINEFCGSSDVALYGLAYSIASLMTLFNDALMKVLTPWTYKSIKNKSYRSIATTCNKLLIGVGLINLSLILVAPELIALFAPAEYYKSIYLIPPLSASIYFVFLFSMFANIEYYYSETKFVAIASICAAITNVILNYIFIKSYGFIAAGYTTLASYILYTVGHYVFMRLVLKKHNNGIIVYETKSVVIISGLLVLLSIAIIPLYKTIAVRYVCMCALIISGIVFRKKIMSIIQL